MVELATARKKEKNGKGFKEKVRMMTNYICLFLPLLLMTHQGAKCAQHENSQHQGGGDQGGGDEEGAEKKNLADKFRHHPIYKLSLGQVNTNTTINSLVNPTHLLLKAIIKTSMSHSLVLG